ncbi:MAG TPA: alkaline phosphatase family protein [Anaerolineales bacterium]|jgi:hypothetical protein
MKKLIALTILCLALSACASLPNPATSTVAVPTDTRVPTGSPVPETLTPQPQELTPSPGAAQKVPNFDHIVMIVFENQSYENVIGNSSWPTLNSLATQNVLLTNYFAVRHPSLPNYIAMISGDTQGFTKDCTDCFLDKPNLADLIEKSGRTWKTYQEDMPSPCYVGDAKPYYQKHNPFIYFDSIRLNLERCQRSEVPLTQLEPDLAAGQLPNFAFIMPNLCNSAHSCPVETADAWLKAMVSRLQSSDALGQNSLIVVTFDEGGEGSNGSCCGMGGRAGGHIATVLVSPQARVGFQDTTAYSHYSLLKTILAAWGLPELGNTQMPGTDVIERPWSANGLVSTSIPSGVAAAQPNPQVVNACTDAAPVSGKYNLKLCLTGPADGANVSGDLGVSATLEVGGPSSMNVQRMVFYLDGTYLLSDFQPPFTFTLPTANWPDGSHNLTVEALMRDSFVSPPVGVTLTFNNGLNQPASQNNAPFQPSAGNPPAPGAAFVMAAIGDATGGETNAGKVADLIASYNPNLLLYLGDVYERGSQVEYLNWYGSQGSFFDRFRSITNPTIGNHEYLTQDAAGYFNYWGNIPNYYSFNAGGWHFVSLNSNVQRLPVGQDSAQYHWLATDLAANAGACTIVYYHHPVFNIGPEGQTVEMNDIWKLLADHHVTIVLNGHDHDYQRWQPLDGEGQPRSTGITEFVAGAGGHGLQSFKTTDWRVAYSSDQNPKAFGALFFQLNQAGTTFSYRSVDGSLLDSGVIPCAGSPADTLQPGAPGNLSAIPAGATQVNLNWSAASDNTGIARYAIYRDGALLAEVPGASLAYQDTAVLPRSSHSYLMLAIDPAGNRSTYSLTVSVTTPDVADHQVLTAAADGYITSESPERNNASAPTIRIDSTPDLRGYLRFDVHGLGGRSIARAQLRLFANSGTTKSLSLFALAANNWDESTLNYGNAPAFGQLLETSDPFKAGTWITLDVTSYVTGEGQFDFGLGTTGTTAISLASRESGANAPQLLIDLR